MARLTVRIIKNLKKKIVLVYISYHLRWLVEKNECIVTFQVINKSNDSCFTPTDEKVFSSYLQFCGIGLRNAQLYEKSQLEVKRNQVLLDLARMIFEEQSTMEHMVFRILTHTQSLIQCQRVQVSPFWPGSRYLEILKWVDDMFFCLFCRSY